jgi:hypothetical protein
LVGGTPPTTKKENEMSKITTQPEADRTQRVILAKKEYDAWKRWNSTGRKGPEPTTVNLEAVRNEDPTTTKKENKMSTPKISVRFYRDGEPMPDRYNTLGWLGYKLGRLSAPWKAELAELGIDNPAQSTWTAVVDGHTIGCVVDGQKVPAALLKKAPAKQTKIVENIEKVVSKKLTAKVTTAAKRPSTAKTTNAKLKQNA